MQGRGVGDGYGWYGEGWIGLWCLGSLAFVPVHVPSCCSPHRPGHTARLHFRDGWKFPFQQNPFVKPWSFEPRSALPAQLCCSGSGLPSLPHSLPWTSLCSPSPAAGAGEALPQTLLQHQYSLQKTPPLPRTLTSWEAPGGWQVLKIGHCLALSWGTISTSPCPVPPVQRVVVRSEHRRMGRAHRDNPL